MARKKRATREKRWTTQWHPSPLKSSFFVASILGFLISAYIVYGRAPNFGLAFMFLFALMFIASIISMTKAPILRERV